MIEYSDHARKKMTERNISPVRVEEVLKLGIRSPDLKNRQRAVGIIEGLKTTVVFMQEKGRTIVITAWDELSREAKGEG